MARNYRLPVQIQDTATRANDGTTDSADPKPGATPRMPASLTPPKRRQSGYAWSLETIRAARDAQLRGQFDQPVRLAEAFRTDDALFVPYTTRKASQSAIKLDWVAAESRAGKTALRRGRDLVVLPPHTRASIHGTLVNHGIAIGYLQDETIDDPKYGPSVRLTLTQWPLEHVRFNPSTNTLETRTEFGAGPITITHGDGRWIVFRKEGIAPWAENACVLPAAFIWAAHAAGLQDWAGSSFSHGSPKITGELPEGSRLQDAAANGRLDPGAQALLDMLTALASGEAVAGILPHGAKAQWLSNGSSAWQVFEQLILNRERAAARVYCGTDAILGAQGGAPGVDIAAMFNVATTHVQGDIEALERGYYEGAILPWCRLHGFVEADAFRAVYLVPDVDADKRAEQAALAIERFEAALKQLRDAQCEVTQDVVDTLVQVLSVPVAAKLAGESDKRVPIQLAPTDIARVVRVDEARASQGLSPVGDERGALFISELEALDEEEAAPGEDVAPVEEAPADAAPVE